MASVISIDGVLLPNKPLSNFEIQDAIKKLGVSGFRCVFVRDTLPNKPKRTECGILNLGDSSGNGTHWVAWLKKKKPRKLLLRQFRHSTTSRIDNVSKNPDIIQHGEDSK